MNYLRKFSLNLFSIFIVFIIYLNFPVILYSSDLNNWQEVASSSSGIQFIDLNSIKYKKGILTLLSKYSDVNPDDKSVLNSNIYRMEIDCDRRLFKDEKNKWRATIDNKLIKQTIINSCKY